MSSESTSVLPPHMVDGAHTKTQQKAFAKAVKAAEKPAAKKADEKPAAKEAKK